MTLARIIGTVVSTAKLPVYEGHKILIAQPIGPTGEPGGKAVLALDSVQAGEGDVVLVLQEGNSARLIVDDSMAPMRCIIVGVVDEVEMQSESGSTVWRTRQR
jgi:ethanolamine utilization protein EutN